jgi:predicted AAA+ superfamily ATPase
VRRCGKSTLFDMMIKKLSESGISEKQIISVNLENPEFDELLDWKKLYNYVNSRLIPSKKNYVFLDEIQNVKDFQRAADGLFIKNNVDLYLTGPNSKYQSGQWATMLSGRYIDISILPLSFKEYVSAVGPDNIAQKFQKYLQYGSFPQVLEFDNNNDKKKYLAGIYNTIIVKDIAENNKIRDLSRLERIIKFMADNIGKETSPHNIAQTMKTEGITINERTVETYLKAFCDGHILYRADRYDVKGKKLLKTLSKYYIVDSGLRYLLLGDRQIDVGRMLENAVYLELLRRNQNVYVGKIGAVCKNNSRIKETVKEVDFVAENNNITQYYHVAQTVIEENTLKREISALDAIKDHNQKFLLTMDYLPNASYNGIRQMNIIDWLLEN